MQLSKIPNLTSTQASQWDGIAPSSPPTLADKSAYRAWCVSDKTNHTFLSIGIPLNPNLRSNRTDNEVVRIAAVVAEYDAVLDGKLRLDTCAYPPSFVCKTFSGHLRLWWELPVSVPVEQERYRKDLLTLILKEVKAVKLAPGFSLEESIDATHFFEVGHGWIKTSEQPSISPDTLRGWCHRAQEKQWLGERTQLKFDDIRAEGAARWPKALEWTTFGPGIRCRRFWDPGADAEAAIVTEHGVRCWTGDKAFVSWSDIFGADWVRSKTDAQVGAALTGWFFESKTGKYWHRNASGRWHSYGVRDVSRRLEAAGLQANKSKGETVAQVDKALIGIQDFAGVHGVYPAFYDSRTVVSIAHQDYLNISEVKPMSPALEPCAWGSGFPWIAMFMEKLFKPEAREWYMHWLAHFYRQAVSGMPGRGLALFLAGPVGSGKTYLNRRIHHNLFGASADASQFLTGSDQFNGNLIACPFWTIDDAVASSDARSRERYSQMVKSIVANEGVVLRGMYREGFLAPWFGRLCVTMNDDPDSLRMIPMTDISNREKISVIHAQDTRLVNGEWADEAHVLAELPFFASYLLHMDPNPKLWGGRFGVKPFLDANIVSDAESTGATSGTLEILESWFARYCESTTKTEWEGTATDLDGQLSAYEHLHRALHRQVKNVSHLQHDLRKMVKQGTPWIEEARVGPTRSRGWKFKTI